LWLRIQAILIKAVRAIEAVRDVVPVAAAPVVVVVLRGTMVLVTPRVMNWWRR
jgi:hypothetical protein